MGDEQSDRAGPVTAWPQERRELRHADHIRAVLAGMPRAGGRPAPWDLDTAEPAGVLAAVEVLDPVDAPEPPPPPGPAWTSELPAPPHDHPADELVQPEAPARPLPPAPEPILWVPSSAASAAAAPATRTPPIVQPQPPDPVAAPTPLPAPTQAPSVAVTDAPRFASFVPLAVPPPWASDHYGAHPLPPPPTPPDFGMAAVAVVPRHRRLRRALLVLLLLVVLAAGAAGGAFYWYRHTHVSGHHAPVASAAHLVARGAAAP